jgi:hypothetical protein
VAVVAGADIQPLIDANPPGSTFCFAKGLYQLTSTIQTKEKAPNSIRAGAVIDGRRWFHRHQRTDGQRLAPHGPTA